jgi:hypothetical protein
VVDVGVSDDDLLHFQFVLAHDGQNVFNVVAGIDDHGFVRGFIADDRAVTLQRTYGKNFVDHALQFSLSRRKSATEKSEVRSQIAEATPFNRNLAGSHFCNLTSNL